MNTLPTAFSSANLPSLAEMGDALRNLQTVADGADGGIILKMDKTGHWVFGAKQDDVDDDAIWAVNPFSFVHGYIAWGDGVPLGEAMGPLTLPIPAVGPAPEDSKKGWELQLGCSFKCMSGQDEGMEVRYLSTSKGGTKAIATLGLAVSAQVLKDQTKPVALIRLEHTTYQHKSFGKQYVPNLKIVDWVGLDGDEAQAVADEVEPEPDTATRRRRRG